jgi:hypothetical protein
LVVVPAVYSLFSRLESRKHERDLKVALQELGEAGAAGQSTDVVQVH